MGDLAEYERDYGERLDFSTLVPAGGEEFAPLQRAARGDTRYPLHARVELRSSEGVTLRGVAINMSAHGLRVAVASQVDEATVDTEPEEASAWMQDFSIYDSTEHEAANPDTPDAAVPNLTPSAVTEVDMLQPGGEVEIAVARSNGHMLPAGTARVVWVRLANEGAIVGLQLGERS